MNNKKCVNCVSFNVIRKGKVSHTEIQKWYCKSCHSNFQSNRKEPLNREGLFFSFVFGKQNISELSKSYHIRGRAVQKVFDEYQLTKKVHNPRKVYLVVDAKYFGGKRSKHKFCLVVFRDEQNKEDLWWKFCETETGSAYREGRSELEKLGYEIKGVTADGLALIREAFSGIPFQMCLVHMERLVIRGTTRSPNLEAGIQLLRLTRLVCIERISKAKYVELMILYKRKYMDFLNEKTINETTGESRYAHEDLRRAFMSLYSMTPYLFTYQTDRNISPTSNSIEGHFSHLELRVLVHRGLSLERKQKLITAILLNSSVALD